MRAGNRATLGARQRMANAKPFREAKSTLGIKSERIRSWGHRKHDESALTLGANCRLMHRNMDPKVKR
jgi:hypothetical protein